MRLLLTREVADAVKWRVRVTVKTTQHVCAKISKSSWALGQLCAAGISHNYDRRYVDCNWKTHSALYLSCRTSCLPLHWLHSTHRAATLPSNAKRLFPIIMPFNAIRMVIRLQMKCLHDTVVWVRWCGEFRKAAGGEFERTERLQPNLGLIC